MPPVSLFGKRTFPNVGAWVKLDDGQLGVIFDIQTTRTIDSAVPDAEPVVERLAHIHIIDEKRETKMALVGNKAVTHTEIIPADQLKKATYSDIKAHLDTKEFPPFVAASMGYELSSSELSNLTALQRMRLGKSFNDADIAQARVEESEEELRRLKFERIKQDPRALKAEEEIEVKRLEFLKWATEKRQSVADEITQGMK